MPELRIAKGGRLILKPKSGKNLRGTDITERAISCLFENCELDEDVTLRDIMLLLNTNLQSFNLIIGNYCKEFVELAINHKFDPSLETAEQHQDKVDYVELYWSMEIDEKKDYPTFYMAQSIQNKRMWQSLSQSDVNNPEIMKKYTKLKTYINKDEVKINGYLQPSLHAVSFESKIDIFGDFWTGGRRVGSRINYDMMALTYNDMFMRPIRLRSTIDVDIRKNHNKSIITATDASFKLGDILYGILWELSWHGNPKKRSKRVKEIKNYSVDLSSFNLA